VLRHGDGSYGSVVDVRAADGWDAVIAEAVRDLDRVACVVVERVGAAAALLQRGDVGLRRGRGGDQEQDGQNKPADRTRE
jgi:hypothetical protein